MSAGARQPVIDRVNLNLAALGLLLVLTFFFVALHELSGPECDTDPCAAASKVHRYCHALPLPFFRQLDDDYFDVWPKFGCARDLVPDDYPEGTCGPIGAAFMCAPSPLRPLR